MRGMMSKTYVLYVAFLVDDLARFIHFSYQDMLRIMSLKYLEKITILLRNNFHLR